MNGATAKHPKVRWSGAAALLILGVLLLTLSVPAIFVRNQLLNTDRYVSTVSPLAKDPAIQTTVARRVTDEIAKKVDLPKRIREGLASLNLNQAKLTDSLDVLVGPVAGSVQNWLYGRVLKIVQSNQFARAWDTANRVAHDQLDHVLIGSDSGVIQSSGNTVSIDIGVFVKELAKQLAGQGFNLAAKIPSFSVRFTVLRSDDLPRVRSAVSWLKMAAIWLPLFGLVLIIGGIFLAPRRLRGVLLAGVLIAIFAGVILSALAWARHRYLEALPASAGSPKAAAAIFDILLRNLKAAVQVGLTLGVSMAVAAWVLGPTKLAKRLRERISQGLDFGVDTLNRFDTPMSWANWMPQYRGWLFAGASTLAGVIWVLWDPLSWGTLIWAVLLTLVLIGALEITIRATVSANGSNNSEGPSRARPEGPAGTSAADHTY